MFRYTPKHGNRNKPMHVLKMAKYNSLSQKCKQQERQQSLSPKTLWLARDAQ